MIQPEAQLTSHSQFPICPGPTGEALSNQCIGWCCIDRLSWHRLPERFLIALAYFTGYAGTLNQALALHVQAIVREDSQNASQSQALGPCHAVLRSSFPTHHECSRADSVRPNPFPNSRREQRKGQRPSNSRERPSPPKKLSNSTRLCLSVAESIGSASTRW
jgi:hypothetical protein